MIGEGPGRRGAVQLRDLSAYRDLNRQPSVVGCGNRSQSSRTGLRGNILPGASSGHEGRNQRGQRTGEEAEDREALARQHIEDNFTYRSIISLEEVYVCSPYEHGLFFHAVMLNRPGKKYIDYDRTCAWKKAQVEPTRTQDWLHRRQGYITKHFTRFIRKIWEPLQTVDLDKNNILSNTNYVQH